MRPVPIRLKPRKRRQPSSRNRRSGWRVWTSQVCIQPLNQRVRWRIHGISVAGASSSVGRSMRRRAIAEARQAQAEIGILGDVERVPAADLVERGAAEMIGGAAERQRHVEGGERRQEPVEERRIFDREQAREQAGVAVVDDERRLQAGESRAARAGRSA